MDSEIQKVIDFIHNKDSDSKSGLPISLNELISTETPLQDIDTKTRRKAYTRVLLQKHINQAGMISNRSTVGSLLQHIDYFMNHDHFRGIGKEIIKEELSIFEKEKRRSEKKDLWKENFLEKWRNYIKHWNTKKKHSYDFSSIDIDKIFELEKSNGIDYETVVETVEEIRQFATEEQNNKINELDIQMFREIQQKWSTLSEMIELFEKGKKAKKGVTFFPMYYPGMEVAEIIESEFSIKMGPQKDGKQLNTYISKDLMKRCTSIRNSIKLSEREMIHISLKMFENFYEELKSQENMFKDSLKFEYEDVQELTASEFEEMSANMDQFTNHLDNEDPDY